MSEQLSQPYPEQEAQVTLPPAPGEIVYKQEVPVQQPPAVETQHQLPEQQAQVTLPPAPGEIVYK